MNLMFYISYLNFQKRHEITNDTVYSEHGIFCTWLWLDHKLWGGEEGEVGDTHVPSSFEWNNTILLSYMPLWLLTPLFPYLDCQVFYPYLSAALSPPHITHSLKTGHGPLPSLKAHNGFFGAKSHGLFSLLDTIDHMLLVETLLSLQFFGVTPLIFLSAPSSISVSFSGFSFFSCLFMKIFPQGSILGSHLMFCSLFLLLLISSAIVYVSVTPELMSLFQISHHSIGCEYSSFNCPSVRPHSVYQWHQHLACTLITLFPSLPSGISFVHICSILPPFHVSNPFPFN